jgi:hypothetical protein
MNELPATKESTTPAAASVPGSKTSRLVRRIHMFTGLFLAPWMVMYALSTLVMAHHQFVNSFYSSQSPALSKERELDYSRSFSTNMTRDQIAQQILQDVGMEGAYSVSGGRNGSPLLIQRQHALPQRRITFNSSQNKIVIEKEEFRTPTVLERMHRRRGYHQPYALEDTWGFTVDVAVVTMVFWSLSGLWLAWEIKAARFWAALSLATGLGLFALFAALI